MKAVSVRMDMLITRHLVSARKCFSVVQKSKEGGDGRVTVSAPTLQGFGYLSADNFSHNHSIFYDCIYSHCIPIVLSL